MTLRIAGSLLALAVLLVPLVAVGEEAAPGPAADPVAPALEPFVPWLRHPDDVLRALAAFELRRHVDEGAVRLATNALAAEQDAVVLGCLLGSLAGRARPDLVREGGAVLPGLLLRLLDHPHPLVRERAWDVLRLIPADPVAGDGTAWRQWWIRSRKDLATEQQAMRRAARAPPPRPATTGEEGRTTPAPREGELYDHVAELRRDGLEVCIVMDHTGSMAPVIGAASARAAALVSRLAWLVPRFRAGLVTYDDAARLRTELTTDGRVLEKVFRKVSAGGGGDWEEGVDKGIALALQQDRLGWSARAHRVIVVIGDAPPHRGDVDGLLRRIAAAREDVLFEHPVTVHAVSTYSGGVDHFGAIAAAGGGIHVTLGAIATLQEELVALSFGAAWRDRVNPWLKEIERLHRDAPKR